MTRSAFACWALAALMAATQPVAAQEAGTSPALRLELNAAQPSEKGCRLTFVVSNGLGSELAKASFEIALFDASGIVDRLAVLDFQELPAGKTKVTRFDLPGVECGKIGRILVNHAVECAGEGVAASACMRQLSTATKTPITFGV